MATWAQERAKVRQALNDEQVAEAFIDTPALDRVMNEQLRAIEDAVGLGEVLLAVAVAASATETALVATYDYAEVVGATLDRTNQPLAPETERWIRAARRGVPLSPGDPAVYAVVRALDPTTAAPFCNLLTYPVPLVAESITLRFRTYSADLTAANIVPATPRVCDLWRATVQRRVALRMPPDVLMAHKLTPQMIEEWAEFAAQGLTEAKVRNETGKRPSRVKLGSFRAWRT